MLVTRRKVCVLWKLEGDISVSEGEIPSEFEWGDTAHARRKTFSIVSVAARAPVWCGVEKKQCSLLHLECLKFAMHTAARRKKRHSLIWKSERARLSRDTDV